MAAATIENTLEALQVSPKIIGHVISESNGSFVLHNNACTVEIARDHVAAQQKGEDGTIELTLTKDAEILVSTLISVQKGFTADDVFGFLVPDVLANNCNCNCNCESGNCNCNCNCSDCTECSRCSSIQLGPEVVTLAAPAFRKPFANMTQARLQMVE